MKRVWSGVITAAVVATVGLGAQAPAPGAPAPGAQSKPVAPAAAQAGAQGKIMVSGCIERGAPASATATAGGGAQPGAAATASASSQSFVLADAKMASTPGAAGAVGTTGTAATRYELEGDAKTISPHLNHQVEITGTLSSAASPTDAAPAAPGATAAAPKLKVESVKMVSATCS